VVTAARTESDLIRRIQATRRELLDLSARNRLISTPRGTARGRKVEIADERSEEVFRLLVRERKAMSFLPGVEETEPVAVDENPALAQPEVMTAVDEAPDPRHVDLRLQTRLTSERLQARLLAISYDAQTYEQEQGVSILYLAMGFLKWYESPTSEKARYAPLLLIPVDLGRQSAASRFHLRYREEDIATNLSVQAKLRAEFAIELPDVPEMDEMAPEGYFDAVNQAIEHQPRWEVLRDDMVLWFFSFAKYLMYRDLDPANWPDHSPLGNNPTLASLLGEEGFASEPPFCGEDDKIDPLIPPERMIHVTDADSSQAVAIEEVRRGRHLVIQGPPGTGKSQTITNLIATAVKGGKKVLFVAEKMAALEVVHGRLERLGLGSICLELHSSKANKKTVLEEIARTIALGKPKAQPTVERVEALQAAIDRLNRHAEVMNTPIEPAGVTPYQVIGQLAQLYARGIESVTLPLPSPESWSGPAFREHCRELADLQEHLQEIGPPGAHPWRGVGRTEPLLPTDLKALQTEIAGTIEALTGVAEAFAALTEAIDARPPTPSLEDIRQLERLATRILEAPPIDRRAIAHPAWDLRPDEIRRLIERGRAVAEGLARLRGTVADVAWRTDLEATRRSLASDGRSWFRWFRRDYREAVATLRGILKAEMPRTLDDRVTLVDEVIGLQDSLKAFEEGPTDAQLGRDAFGELWQGTRSDWDALDRVIRWDAEGRSDRPGSDHRGILARLERPDALREPLKAVSAKREPASTRLHRLEESLRLEAPEGFRVASTDLVPVAGLVERFRLWQGQPESLSKWISYRLRRRRLEESGLGSIVAGVQDGRISPGSAVDQFEAAYYQTLIRDAIRQHPGLAEFDGRSHERRIEEFRGLDKRRIELARVEVATAHHEAIPRHASGGEMAVLRREFEKKRRHKPIRQLIKEAGTAILGVKPVFLMSPISVAQFLEPGSVTFDLLLIDEASQVSPVDALGAMARAGQVVVVGDEKQLPPTRFFRKMLDEEPAEGEVDDLDPGDLESILGLCLAQGMAQRMLRWHYRSRHHSLIAVSNHEFYDGRLYVVPSPSEVTPGHGLHFRPVEGGTFDRGNSATNRVEARAVAQAVVEQARRHPGQTLGVGAFSVAQRDAIRDELEVLQREHVDLAPFFATGRAEPFFVKNLENIQGDERDVIFISVGYARDPSGFLAMNFGPLSSQGGERRLNVLISRARERCEVFSSITADDIDLERAKSRGAAAFRTFLRYAETGLLDAPAPTGIDQDSDFERQVAEALEGLGHEVQRQVGTAGFVIDLAIVDPSKPGRYLLGIESDGATYHSSRSARDRDRLKDAVLKDRGWKIHRVWSTDWFHRPAEQLQRIVEAIEKANKEWDLVEDAEAAEGFEAVGNQIERGTEPEEAEGEAGFAWARPYVEADLKVPSSTPIPETKPRVLEGVVTSVVRVEGPIHKDEIARRITTLWGQARTGARIAEAIAKAIEAGIRSGTLRAEEDFIALAEQPVVPVRNRSEVGSANLKKPELIAPSEFRQAILHLVAEQVGLKRDELPGLVGRALGFKMTSPKLRELVENVLGSMLEAGTVVSRDQKLFLT
jgi:very-short-patch-repair endonuclease/DNA polymerase III delta prime subunit